MCWCDSLCIRSRSAWPVSATSGERSRNASATAVIRFVAPGPSVPRQTPARARQPAVHVGHVGAALLVADGHERDRRVLERLVEVQRLLARDPEHVLDALGLEALDEQLRRLALRHSALSARSATSGRRPCPATLGNFPPGPWLGTSASSACRARLIACARRVRRSGQALHDPRRRIRPRRRHEPVRRDGLRVPRLGLQADPRATTTAGTELGVLNEPRDVRVLLQSTSGSASFSGASQAGSRAAVARQDLLRARARRRPGAAAQRARPLAATVPAPLRVTGPGLLTLRGRAGNGRTDGTYRGALEFRGGDVRRRQRDQRAAGRRVRQGRDPARVAGLVADRGAQGAGRRGAHLRAHDVEGAAPASSTTPTRARRSTAARARSSRRRTPLPTRPPGSSSPTTARRCRRTSSRPRAGAPRTSRTRRSGPSRSRG